MVLFAAWLLSEKIHNEKHHAEQEGYMPRPYVAEMAYQTFCTYVDAPQPSWDLLSVSLRLAWTMAIRMAIQEVHTVRCTVPLRVAGSLGKSPHHRWKSLEKQA